MDLIKAKRQAPGNLRTLARIPLATCNMVCSVKNMKARLDGQALRDLRHA